LKISKRLVIFSIFAILFLAATATAQAGPAAQTTPVPDPSNFVVYGVPWMLVGAVIVGLLSRYVGLGEDKALIVTAGWTVVGYLLIQNLPALEAVAPWLPVYLPQLLMAIVLFGFQLGIIQVAGRAKRAYSALRK
jgi:hypothetical protein